VLVLDQLNARRTASLVGRAVARRDLGRIRGVEVWQGVETLRITAEPTAWLQADGELLGKAAEVQMTVADERVGVIV